MESKDQSSRAKGHACSGTDLCLKHRILEGIDPENVQNKGDSCRILMGTDWASMLGSLPMLDEALIITGNSAAVLGSTRMYPMLSLCPSGARATSHDGTFDLEFVPWESARFVAHACQGMASYFLEFSDFSGLVIHRVCLTDRTNRENFVDWVQTHQSSGQDLPKLTSFPTSRWQTVQQRHWFDYEDVTPLETVKLLAVLEKAMDIGQSVSAVVGNEGAVQSGEFVPKQIHDLRKWTFASDDTIGLHFDMSAIGEVVIHRTPVGESEWLSALKCFDEEGALKLALTAPASARAEEWDEFLRKAAE